MNTLLPPRTSDTAVASPNLPIEGHRESDLNERAKVPLLTGLIGVAAATLTVVALRKAAPIVKRKLWPLTSQQRTILKEIIERGERKRWDFSYDEYFIFKLLPMLKMIAR